MSRRYAFALTLLFSASPVLAQDTWVADKTHSEVSFQIRHFVAKVRGRFTDFSCTVVADSAKPENSSVEFALKATSIDTAAEGRDKHLRSADFFDVEKFPEITFKSSKVKPAGKDKFDVTGVLIMHGVSKELTLPVSYGGVMMSKGRDGQDQPKSGFSIETTLNRKDFGIVWNRVLDQGATMLGEDVAISINLEMSKQAPAKPASN